MTTIALELAGAGRSGPDPTAVPADVLAAQQGSEPAFEALYRAHVDRVYALARRLAYRPAEADDLTQDVFVRAWEALASFRGASSFGTWLYRLAVNVILSDRRSAWRRSRRFVSSEETDGPVGRVAPAPVGIKLDLEQAIAGLPPGARTVFVLHDVEGYQHREISELTGIAVGTSKAQLFRARRLLREALA
ncbi:MAG: RNA polymerase sigma factor [Gemmatimonadales bacterium]